MFVELGQIYKEAFLGIERPKKEKTEAPDEAPKQYKKREGVFIGKQVGGYKKTNIYLPTGDKRHKVLRGPTRCGKTTLGKRIAVEKASNKEGVGFLDNADGEAIVEIVRALPEEELDRLIILDHADKNFPLPLGGFEWTGDYFLDEELTEDWIDFFERNFGLEGKYMTQELISFACRTAFSVRGTTILDVFKLVKDPEYRKQLLEKLNYREPKHREIIDYWNQFESQKDVINSGGKPFLRRTNVLFRRSVLKFSLGYKAKQSLNYRDWMDRKKIVLIRVPESLKKTPVKILASIHIMNFLRGALARDDTQIQYRTPFTLIADEPQTWLSQQEDVVDDIYSKSLKYGLGLITLFQADEQISKKSKDLLRIIKANKPDLFLFSDEDVKEEELKKHGFEDLPKYHYMFEPGQSSKKVLINAPKPIEFVRSRAEAEAIIKEHRKNWNYHYEFIKKEINKRSKNFYEVNHQEQSNDKRKIKINQKEEGQKVVSLRA